MKLGLQWHEDYNGSGGHEELEVVNVEYGRDIPGVLEITLKSATEIFVGIEVTTAQIRRVIPLHWLREFTIERTP